MTPIEVKQTIMEYAQDNDVSLLEATIAVADSMDIELEDIAKHINGSLKEMMQLECETSGMLKRDSQPSYTFQ